MEIGRFLVFNLGASLAAGLLAWLLVISILRLMQTRSAFLHTGYLALPLIKSVLILSGMGLVFPWPAAWFGLIQSQAVAPLAALPFILGWLVLAACSYAFLTWRARQDIMKKAVLPNVEEASRLKAALNTVAAAYQLAPCCEVGEILCCISNQIPADPDLRVSEKLLSPLALVEGGHPVIVLPRGLLDELEDNDLALLMAHELNHFALRKPVWESMGVWRLMILVSPIAFLLAGYFHREEEKSCDDLAVVIFKQPEAYAAMLLKSYQFARRRPEPGGFYPLPFIPGLLGSKPLISERVERLLAPARTSSNWKNKQIFTWIVWVLLAFFLFLARFGS